MLKQKWMCILLILSLVAAITPLSASAVSSTTSHVILYVESKDAYVNSQNIKLEVPAKVFNGRTYLPARFLSESLGFQIEAIPDKKILILKTVNSYIEIYQKDKQVYENGLALPFNDYVTFYEGRLLVQMGWIAKAMGAKYEYTSAEKKIEISYIKMPTGGSLAEVSKPVAKFAFAKPSYRIGEPIEIDDLSYDPDGEGITKKWSGLQEAFFQAGTYPISLTVTDKSGNVSDTYTKNIRITSEVFLTKDEYPFYYQKTGSAFQTNMDLLSIPRIASNVQYDYSRKLLVSDSPETIKETGILYQDKVNGKGRLYANHLNGMDRNVTFAIFATNLSESEVQIQTTNKGEVYPSPLANLIGHVSSVDFLLDDKSDEYNTVKPGETIIYRVFPEFFPSYGVNTIYDLETNGETLFTFVAMDPSYGAEQIFTGGLMPLAYNGHVRGTFPTSDMYMTVHSDGYPIPEPKRISIGEQSVEPFVKGLDALENREATNVGNYGLTYHITIHNPGKLAVLLRPRGGPFKGPIKMDGRLVMAPVSGTLTRESGVYLLKRTTGQEATLSLELTPPAGSAFPVDIILYPLKDLK